MPKIAMMKTELNFMKSELKRQCFKLKPVKIYR